MSETTNRTRNTMEDPCDFRSKACHTDESQNSRDNGDK
jgi:hypothetical protein